MKTSLRPTVAFVSLSMSLCTLAGRALDAGTQALKELSRPDSAV